LSLELLNTLGTLTTALVITATAITAVVQLRHLRASNQINALLSIQNELDSPDFREAELLIRQELKRALEDAAFCAACLAYARQEPHASLTNEHYVKIRQAALLVGNTFENLGGLVKNDIFDRNLFLDIYSWIVTSYWDQLEGFAALSRAYTGEQSIWENFEYITVLSREYIHDRPITYPPGVERIELRLPDAAKSLLG
jgi:hypothetical protein